MHVSSICIKMPSFVIILFLLFQILFRYFAKTNQTSNFHTLPIVLDTMIAVLSNQTQYLVNTRGSVLTLRCLTLTSLGVFLQWKLTVNGDMNLKILVSHVNIRQFIFVEDYLKSVIPCFNFFILVIYISAFYLFEYTFSYDIRTFQRYFLFCLI